MSRGLDLFPRLLFRIVFSSVLSWVSVLSAIGAGAIDAVVMVRKTSPPSDRFGIFLRLASSLGRQNRILLSTRRKRTLP